MSKRQTISNELVIEFVDAQMQIYHFSSIGTLGILTAIVLMVFEILCCSEDIVVPANLDPKPKLKLCYVVVPLIE